MKKYLFSFALRVSAMTASMLTRVMTSVTVMVMTIGVTIVMTSMPANATDYYKITSFPIDGVTVRDTFLIAVEYAGNTYIWDGQNQSGKNYVCLEHYSSNTISGNYADNEVAVVHNQWHAYHKLFSVLSKGDGNRDEKGGYYVGGVKGTNGISFSAGQIDAEIEFVESEGIKIATKSGVGVFRFNITPNDPHGFKFYEHDINMLYPTLYVKGANPRYTTAGQQAVDLISEDPSTLTRKVIKDGQILIERNGETYNLEGKRL